MEEEKLSKLLDQRRNGWLDDLYCTQQIRSLKHSMKFTPEDHQELGSRMHRTLNKYKPTKVSPSRRTTIHLELVCAMVIEKLQEKAKMSEKTASSKAGSEIKDKPVGDNSSSSKPVSQKQSLAVTQSGDPVATPSTSSPASSDSSTVTNPESKVESIVSSNAVQVITADMLSGVPRKMPSATSIHLQDTPNQLSNTATSSVASPASTIVTGVQSGAQNTNRKAHFSDATPMSNITTKVCLSKTEQALTCSSLEKGKIENKADAKPNAKADVKTRPELPVMEQKFTMAVQPSLISVTKLQEEKDKNKATGVKVKNKLNENLIAVQNVNEQKCVYDWDRKNVRMDRKEREHIVLTVNEQKYVYDWDRKNVRMDRKEREHIVQTVNEQKYVYDWDRKKNVLMDKKERGHILEGDAKDLSKSEGMVNRPKPKPYPNPGSTITLRLKGNGPRTEPGEVIVIDLSDEDEEH